MVRNDFRLAHAFTHFEAMWQRLRDHIARRPNRLPERSQRRYRSPSHGGEHPQEEGTPGDFSPPIRPSTATSQAPRVGCCTNHIRARPQISCRSPQPRSWNRPLPTWDIRLLPPEPPGALWVSARIPYGPSASPASYKDTERAIPSSRLPGESCVRSGPLARHAKTTWLWMSPRYCLRGGNEREARLGWMGTRPIRDGHLRPVIHTDDFSVDFQGLA